MNKVKSVGKYVIVFIGVLIVLFLLLVVTSMIPREAIQDNLEESAKFYERKGWIYELQPRRSYTYLHYYLDSTELNIIYCMDTSKPIESAMWARFYEKDYVDGNNAFIEVVNGEQEANQQYLRYWHGCMVILRPLLTIFNVEQIYILNGIILAVLAIILFVVLWKRSRSLALVYLLSMILIAFPIVSMCLAYVWSFYIMLIASIVAILIERKGNQKLNYLFLITGMLTCFFDLLTTEITTLFVPLLFVLIIRKKENRIKDFKEAIIFIIKAGVLWSIGYFGMWFAKWILASIILNINAIDYVKEQALLRINGLQGLESKKELYLVAITRNWHSLYPLNAVKRVSHLWVIFIVGALATLVSIDWKNIRKKWFTWILLLISIIPYLRYLVLANHSYSHYFFTFRTQIITLIAILYLFTQGSIYIKIKEKLKPILTKEIKFGKS